MEDKKRSKTCCFFGHRKINQTQELSDRMFKITEQLITDYQPKSGTKVAYDFAVKKCRQIINVFEA